MLFHLFSKWKVTKVCFFAMGRTKKMTSKDKHETTLAPRGAILYVGHSYLVGIVFTETCRCNDVLCRCNMFFVVVATLSRQIQLSAAKQNLK